ncbi:hypothetical protein M404DRAFT_384939 [Pisolithus tinctorius Marx 270]|uniref:Uncharacterized protein n=1 Tax=Pisolithus tinctorius Marx 270 TaxID=870435 RepID=A0A0C3IBD8_PISTI|nr:hypothetical protein M404DRAFT_384939 [Pisolithus tinctorius Marx 270]
MVLLAQSPFRAAGYAAGNSVATINHRIAVEERAGVAAHRLQHVAQTSWQAYLNEQDTIWNLGSTKPVICGMRGAGARPAKAVSCGTSEGRGSVLQTCSARD